MSLRVLFIYTDFYDNYPGYAGGFYTGIGYVSSALKREGHQTDLIHIKKPELDREEFITGLKENDPHLIAFTSTTNMFPSVVKFTKWIREAGCDLPIICGGVHPTLSAEETLSTPGIDMVCLGEGEEALAELCGRLEEGRDYSNIDNIWVKARGRGEVKKNPIRPIVHNLDSLPFPDREIYDYPNLTQESKGIGVFMASRGCPYSCTYCSNEALRNICGDKRNYLRFRSAGNMVAEIKEVTKRYPFIKYVFFDDNIFFLKKDFAREFTAIYPGEVGLPFGCNMHPNGCNKDMVRLLREAGCKEVKIGLESGNENVRKEVLNRNLSQEVMINAFRTCKEEGIKVISFNMVGLPEETPETILDTIKLNALVKSDETQCSIFQPYPGTKLFQVCDEGGMISGRESTDFFFSSTLNHQKLSQKQLIMFSRYFHKLVHLYMLNYSLPRHISRLGEILLDKILIFRYTPEISRAIKYVSHYFKEILSDRKSRISAKKVEENT